MSLLSDCQSFKSFHFIKTFGLDRDDNFVTIRILPNFLGGPAG